MYEISRVKNNVNIPRDNISISIPLYSCKKNL